MTFQMMVGQTTKFLSDRSPAILTAVGVTGVIMTGVLSGKAAIKAERLIADEYGTDSRNIPLLDLTLKDKAIRTWKCYVPPAIVGSVTIAAVIGANQIGTRRTAALAAAYAISDKAFTEYKDKIVEKLGENKERAARDEIAQERVAKTPVKDIVITGGGTHLCFEPYTGRYFQSDMESLKKAQNDLNYIVLNHFYASLSDFYDLIGLERTKLSDEVGWNSNEQLELSFTTVLAENNQPALSMDFRVVPIRDYHRVQ